MGAPMSGKFVGYVAGHDPLHGFLSRIVRDRMGIRERHPAFRVFRLSGSNEVYAYEEKSSRARMICKFYGPQFGWDRDRADPSRPSGVREPGDASAATTWSARRTMSSGRWDSTATSTASWPSSTTPASSSATRSDARSTTVTMPTCSGGSRRSPTSWRPSTTGRRTATASISMPTAATSTVVGRLRRREPRSGSGMSMSFSWLRRPAGGSGRRCGRTSRSGCTATRPRPTSCSATGWTSPRSIWSG